jgi:hypothetical protein
MTIFNSPKQQLSLSEFSKLSEEYYNTIKPQLESENKGKYVAVDYVSKEYWIGETASEALEKAKKKYQDRLFYLIQVGYPATFRIQSMIPTKSFGTRNYGFNGLH